MVFVGFYFSKKNKNSEQFTKASGSIPGWTIELSRYATFLSSNTFLGVPGKAFGSNWNAFVFSISMPFAALFVSKYLFHFIEEQGRFRTALVGLPMSTIMIVMGICIILYTVLGGMEAVIWTEVVQGVIKTLGALLILYLIIVEMPSGMKEILNIGGTCITLFL